MACSFPQAARRNPVASAGMPVSASDSRGFLAGRGEMGALVRELDRGRTPIGPTERWPASLRTAVGICLSSRFRPILGTTRHPEAMGGRGVHEAAVNAVEHFYGARPGTVVLRVA